MLRLIFLVLFVEFLHRIRAVISVLNRIFYLTHLLLKLVLYVPLNEIVSVFVHHLCQLGVELNL